MSRNGFARQTGGGLALACACILSASPASGHHSPAIFDQARELRLSGVVTRVDWTNPHVYIHVNVKSDTGTGDAWSIEAQSPRVMTLFGWSPDTLRVGDTVTVVGNPARESGQRAALGRSVMKADGAALPIPWGQAQIRDALREELRRQR